MVAHGMLSEGSIVHAALTRLHRTAINRTEATVVLGRCMRDRLLNQGAEERRIHVVPVWSAASSISDPPRDHNAFRRRWSLGDRFLVMYAGNFGLAHDVWTFLEAARELSGDDDIRFAFVGGGLRKAEVDAFVRTHGLDNCIVEGYQPREHLAELLAAGDVHLVTMEPRMNGLVVPSKFYGVCTAGRPCLFIGPPSSEVALSIDAWRCGTVIPPGDVPGLVREIRQLAEDPAMARVRGERARAGHAETAARSVCTQRLARIIEGGASPGASR
jgi:colanic acid biosynthesis glycosyl transferase WcaI